MKLTKLLFLPLSSIAVIPCVSLASCSNAIGVKNIAAKLYYSDNNNSYAKGIEFTLEYEKDLAKCYSNAVINGKYAKFTYNQNYSQNTYEHWSIGVQATMIDGWTYTSTIELDAYFNHAASGNNYLTEIKNVKINSW